MAPIKFPTVSVSTQVYVRHALCEEACSVVSQFKCPCVPLSTQLSSSSAAAAAQTSPASHSSRTVLSAPGPVLYNIQPRRYNLRQWCRVQYPGAPCVHQPEPVQGTALARRCLTTHNTLGLVLATSSAT